MNALPVKLQHLVLYVKDIMVSHNWYRNLFGLQFSAQNDPNGSAAMSVISQSMHFFSFGHYHHDLAFCTRKGVMPDNTSLLNYAVRLSEDTTISEFINRLEEHSIQYEEGRLLKSARVPSGHKVIRLIDPNGYWVEVIGK